KQNRLMRACGVFARSSRCADDSAHGLEQRAGVEWLSDDLLRAESLARGGGGLEAGSKLTRKRDQGGIGIRHIDLTHPLRARVSRARDARDHQVHGLARLRVAGR